jgi:hypothetical protein
LLGHIDADEAAARLKVLFHGTKSSCRGGTWVA